ncbi:hypothetical protein EDD16DRAFT_1008362 [Pisolithus croceorrhizus]|nr:hypothetical protein EDD16DRAFT_1008362 [Pisolithus croceorrhizus]
MQLQPAHDHDVLYSLRHRLLGVNIVCTRKIARLQVAVQSLMLGQPNPFVASSCCLSHPFWVDAMSMRHGTAISLSRRRPRKGGLLNANPLSSRSTLQVRVELGNTSSALPSPLYLHSCCTRVPSDTTRVSTLCLLADPLSSNKQRVLDSQLAISKVSGNILFFRLQQHSVARCQHDCRLERVHYGAGFRSWLVRNRCAFRHASMGQFSKLWART